jgi:hypothetical protein
MSIGRRREHRAQQRLHLPLDVWQAEDLRPRGELGKAQRVEERRERRRSHRDVALGRDALGDEIEIVREHVASRGVRVRAACVPRPLREREQAIARDRVLRVAVRREPRRKHDVTRGRRAGGTHAKRRAVHRGERQLEPAADRLERDRVRHARAAPPAHRRREPPSPVQRAIAEIALETHAI